MKAPENARSTLSVDFKPQAPGAKLKMESTRHREKIKRFEITEVSFLQRKNNNVKRKQTKQSLLAINFKICH